jgi:hypothetical protein
MNKYQLEKNLELLEMVKKLLADHIPAEYTNEATREVIKGINQIKKDIEKL